MRARSPARGSSRSKRVADVNHTVNEVLRSTSVLLDGLPGIGVRTNQADGETVVQLPIRIQADFRPDILGGHAWAKRLGMVEAELEEQQAAADRVVRCEVSANEVRLQVRIRDEVLSRDFTLPPRSPIIKAKEQRIETLVRRG